MAKYKIPRGLIKYAGAGMIFAWDVSRNGWPKNISVRPCWWRNLKAFLWWGPRNPRTGKLLPPGTWAY